MNETLHWLTSGPPWLVYRAMVDLLNIPETDPGVMAARQDMLGDPKIQALIHELNAWPGKILKAHNDASHLLHKLVFLSDLGVKAGDPGIDKVIELIFSHRSPEGILQVLVNIKPAYGGTGEDQYAWMLCDAPLVLAALIKLGLGDNLTVLAAVDKLSSLVRENGWPCAVSPELGKFRGPGSKSAPCPYANLVMLKLFSHLPEAQTMPARAGAETLLTLWEQRKEKKPYLFGMGTDFAKLKAPMIWYDLLNVADVLTSYHWLIKDPRLSEILDVLQSKADGQGRFTPESVWMAWKDWEFGQKKQPSGWVTLVARRALARAGRYLD